MRRVRCLGVLADGLERLLLDGLGFRVLRAEALDPGQAHNNRLLHLWSTDGREVVAKCYFRDDRRARRVRALLAVAWLAIHLSLLVPERISPKQFADPTFDLPSHLARHIQRFSGRLQAIDDLLETLLVTI